MLVHEEAPDWTHAHLDPAWVQHPHVREIVTRRLALRGEENWQGVATFLTQCESAAMRSLITEATADDRPIANAMQQLGDIALRLRNQDIDRQLNALNQRAAQPELGDAERLQLMQEQQALRQLKRQPLKPLSGSADAPF